MAKITVLGIGYVGLSVAAVLARQNEVSAVDIDEKKVAAVNDRSIFGREEIPEEMDVSALNITGSLPDLTIYRNSDCLVICTPTDYCPENRKFDTSGIEEIIHDAYNGNRNTVIVIKSTVPVGFCDGIAKKYPGIRLAFSPEFLREGKSIYDNLYPSRIIAASDMKTKESMEAAESFARLLAQASLKKDPKILLMSYKEAESVKLFSNAYLALRVAFFNELDTFSESKGMNTENIIEGVCADPRIGDHYNNPSFGYGGYCLPKDSRQLLEEFGDLPQRVIRAVCESNDVRKNYIAERILDKAIEKNKAPVIGFYKLEMKYASDNQREAAVLDIIEKILLSGRAEVIIYDPLCKDPNEKLAGHMVRNFDVFAEKADLIVANRADKNILPYMDKVYTRDLFNRD